MDRHDPKHPNDPTAGVEKVCRTGAPHGHPDASAHADPVGAEERRGGDDRYTDGGRPAGLTKLGYDHRKVLQSHQGKPTGEFLPW